MRENKNLLPHFTKLALLIAFLLPTYVAGREFNGFKLEFMNAQKINYYGFGLFTSDKRFDAEMEFFFAQKLFAGETEADNRNQDENAPPPDPRKAPKVTDAYRFWFMSFAAYFHFIRTDKMGIYIGSGIMPLLPEAYSYHWTVGMNFFWSDHFRVFYNYRYLINNAGDYSFPNGSALSFGLKYSFDFMSSGS